MGPTHAHAHGAGRESVPQVGHGQVSRQTGDEACDEGDMPSVSRGVTRSGSASGLLERGELATAVDGVVTDPTVGTRRDELVEEDAKGAMEVAAVGEAGELRVGQQMIPEEAEELPFNGTVGRGAPMSQTSSAEPKESRR